MSDAMETTYHTDPGKRRLLLGMAGVLAAVPGLALLWGIVGGDRSVLGVGLILGLIMLPFAALLWVLVRKARLVVSAAGIQLIDVGRRTLVPWDNIERIRLHYGGEGLVLIAPSTEKWAERQRGVAGFSYAGAPLYDAELRDLYEQKRFVDLKAFGSALKNPALLDQVQRYAPALRAGTEVQFERHETGRKSTRRTYFAIFAATGLVAALAVVAALLDIEFTVPKGLSRGLEIFGRICFLFLAAGFSFMAYRTVSTAVNQFLQKRTGVAILWFLLGLAQVLLVLALLSQVLSD